MSPIGEAGELLPLGIGLNVNYPPLAPEAVAGISLNVQGRTFTQNAGTRATLASVRDEENPDTFSISLPDPGPQDEVPGADVTAFNAGFITIVPISPDYTVNPDVRADIKAGLSGLSGLVDDSNPQDCNMDGVFNGADIVGAGCP